MLIRQALADLLLGARCHGCGRPGEVWCADCDREATVGPFDARPRPCPPGLAPARAVARYDGGVRALIVNHKEHRRTSLAAPLARMLAAAVGAHQSRAPVVLVPVPSRPAATRSRGYDPTWAITAGAARLLNLDDAPVTAARLLRTRSGVADQAGLDVHQRAANLDHSLACSGAAVRRLSARVPSAVFVVCDDVITSGASAREAQRALEAVGLVVIGVASVAAVERRV